MIPEIDLGIEDTNSINQESNDDSGIDLGQSDNLFSAVDSLRDKDKVRSHRAPSSNVAYANRPDTQLFNAWKRDPTPANGAKLLNSLSAPINAAVRAHTGGNSPVDVSTGKLLAMRAMSRYDGSTALPTFLNSQLMPLKRIAASRGTGVKIPRSIPQDKRRLASAESELTDLLGRAPSLAELSDETGIPLKRISQIAKVNLPVVAEQELSGDDESTYSAGDQAVEDRSQVWEKTVYYGLDPVNQFIMQHSTGLYGAPILSNQDIARRLKISPAAVTQRKNVIQRQLDVK